MVKRKGFTIVELIGVIVIISLILVLIIPNVTRVSENTRISMRDSKINTIKTAAENYGNDLINTYQSCINLPSHELEEKCTVSIKDLIDSGYMTSDEKTKSTIIDPTTNEDLKGKALLCYDPINVNVYATFVNEDEDYSCAAVDLESGSFLSFQVRGSGYVGGKNLEAKINARGKGTLMQLTCTSGDTNYIKCSIEEQRLILEMTKNKFLSFDESLGYKEVEIKVEAEFRETDGKISSIEKNQFVKIYPTDLQITDVENKCMKVNSSSTVDLQAINAGPFSIQPSDEKILNASVRDNKVYLNSGAKSGRANISIEEGNGKNSVSLYRDVYNFSATIPHENERKLAVNSRRSITVVHEGIESVTITSDNPDIVKVSSKSNSKAGSITITDGTETEVFIHGESIGSANIKITPKGCGEEISTTYTVINMSLKDKELTTYAGSTNKLSSEIIVENPVDLTCSSSNPSAATCKISEEGTTLEIYPGSEADDNVTIRVESSENGFASLTVHVLPTSLSIKDEDGNSINYICSEVGSGLNDKKAYVSGENTGRAFDLQTDEALADVGLQNEEVNGKRELYMSSKIYGSSNPPYKPGNNTGRTKVSVKELNGNKSDSIDYYLYSMNINSENYNDLEKKDIIKVGQTSKITIESSNAGEIKSVEVENPDIALVTLDEHESYQLGVNVINTRTLTVKGKKIGETNITITNEDCGVKTYTIKVTGHTFAMFIEKGEYVEAIENELVMCNTSEDETSCQVRLPNIGPKENFNKMGFTERKESLSYDDVIYSSGETITLSGSNTGKTIYANAYEDVKPYCEFTEAQDKIKIEDNLSLTLECRDIASGIIKSELTTDDFTVEGNGASIESISMPEDIQDGYSYKIYLGNVKPGVFKITLKENVIKDKLNNQNDALKTTKLLSNNNYTLENFWPDGKENKEDIYAGVYKKEDNSYLMEFYGQGEMIDYMTGENLRPPWSDGYETKISEVIINDDITNIGAHSFNSLSYLTNVTMSNDIRELGAYAFGGTSSLSMLELSKNLEVISESAFNGSGLSSITLPASLETIGERAFANIGQYDENNNIFASLTTINFEDNSSLKTIGDYAFYEHVITSINLPDSVETIGEGAFKQTKTTLNTININDSSKLKVIGSNAFDGVDIQGFNFPITLESIGDYAISILRSVESIHFGKNLKEYGENAITTDSLTTITVDEENPNFTSVDGILYSKDMKILYQCPNEYYLNHENVIDIPEGVEIVASGAFNSYLKYTLTEGATLNIPASVKDLNVGNNFEGYNLSQINVHADNEIYTSVDGVLFNKDRSIIYLLPACYSIESYQIPSTVVTVFNNFAYLNYRVQSITIPNSVNTLETQAFFTDPKYALKEIDIKSSDEVEDNFSLFIMTYDSSDLTVENKRTIYVPSQTLKDKLANTYKSYSAGIFSIEIKDEVISSET